ncbi:membrane protein insertion efficiency factor YidD [Candidatus Peregrinibacteria bacterium RIFOXYC2_FULL_33_13]|nr:MAG: membrane protein insertion efficiency factor YidD [Candidatus Peregrinibacteria bacterium RIFOXYA2_FULL_33_7]OGJ55327.1 MAG: membrane protein insertion efficiency factor YidD [Candidatus Peregrinibacteria bacterium RIFOXYC2_FULL_33_13]
MIKKLFHSIFSLPKDIALLLIRLYQKTISPDHGVIKRLFPFGYCKYSPSCSQYTYLSIEKYGFMKGILKGTYRILRCNPWSKGGIDKP